MDRMSVGALSHADAKVAINKIRHDVLEATSTILQIMEEANRDTPVETEALSIHLHIEAARYGVWVAGG